MAESLRDVHLDLPVNALISYHYFQENDIADMASWGLRLVGDSGAFSAASQGAQIDQDHFYEWAGRWKNALLWTASLDVIGDEEASWRNWRSAPNHLGLVPTIHYGADPKILDRYAEAGVDLVGLGGMVPHKSEPQRLLRWCLKVMRYARDHHPEMRFHGWGVTHPELVMNLPWWSVDSSGYSSAFRFGNMTLVDPSNGRKVAARLDGKEIAKHSTLLTRHYGVDWRRVSVSNAQTRRDVVRVAIRSYQHLESFLQRRWKVTPPTSLVEKLQRADQGPLIHSVLGFPQAQPPRSLSPDDLGPKIHTVIGSMKDARDMGRST